MSNRVMRVTDISDKLNSELPEDIMRKLHNVFSPNIAVVRSNSDLDEFIIHPPNGDTLTISLKISDRGFDFSNASDISLENITRFGKNIIVDKIVEHILSDTRRCVTGDGIVKNLFKVLIPHRDKSTNVPITNVVPPMVKLDTDESWRHVITLTFCRSDALKLVRDIVLSCTQRSESSKYGDKYRLVYPECHLKWDIYPKLRSLDVCCYHANRLCLKSEYRLSCSHYVPIPNTIIDYMASPDSYLHKFMVDITNTVLSSKIM